ncbi:hybrid sensor histidine kinase/response regulator transcription factor [Echinicola rosea]|uniref:histidine kinase n=1 Tax=Echinicola rosea TaxID=1807691 RepID=A0ABQ1V1N8_9BACT|nr:hybrid sensor histidine kinase/response regulator transcription factor [Echinicola rosea]GGF30893.1 hybrid sensor histidine kinase/response regulator [Echinicola rosea]
MRRIILFIVVFTFAVTKEIIATEKPVFHKITTQDGLSHSTVYTIAQDHKGYIWIGTREGLNRYNSYGLKTYYSGQEPIGGLSADRILCLQPASQQRLLIGTSAGLDRYDYGTDRIEKIHYQGKPLGYIKCIFESSDSLVYVCAQSGLYLINQQNKATRLSEERNTLAIAEYKTGVFWLMTSKGVYLVNKFGEIIKEYTDLKPNLGARSNFYCLFKDSKGTMWVGTQEGAFWYVPEKDKFEQVKAAEGISEVTLVRAINEDDRNGIWIGTEKGVFVYDKAKRSLEHHSQSFDQSPYDLSDQSVYCVLKSRENIMWIGTYFGGVNYVKLRESGFVKVVPDGGEKGLSGKAVSQLTEDRKGRLWIGSEDAGVTQWSKDRQKFTYFLYRKMGNSISGNNIHAIQQDHEGNIWLGTFLEGVDRYDPDTGKFTNYRHDPADSTTISHNNVFSLMSDSKDNLWIGTWKGINIYDKKKERFRKFKPQQIGERFIYDMLEDHSGKVWICTRNDGIFRYDPVTDQLDWFNKNHFDNHGLTANKVIHVFQDSQNRVWFGTLNEGLLQWDSDAQHFSAFTKSDGLSNNNVYGIQQDQKGNLWLSTNNGLTVMDPVTGKTKIYDKSNGLQDTQFNFKSSYKDGDGRMYFGTVNGMYHFHPDSINAIDTPPNIHFTELKLFNKPLEVGGVDGILSSQIDEAQSITLKYSQNVITFDFVATNYFSPGKNVYSYYLEGFEKDWNKPNEKHSATYTNLSPGTYTFHVKAANPDGVWSGERTLLLTVAPPFWWTPWAKVIYGLLVITAFFGYRRYLYLRHQEKMTYQLERVEKEKIQELNQHKLNFFTYISHEFKTPLTLIIAVIDKFLDHQVHSSHQQEDFRLIKRNASRLHFLIDQLMEFRKTESDHTDLSPKWGDVILFLQDTFLAFLPLYHKKDITHHFRTNCQGIEVLFDADKLEKIITNLVSNAVKSTPRFGEITMEVEMSPSDIPGQALFSIHVVDNGRGLTKEELDKIFMPFYKGNNPAQAETGSGIGLALVKSLTKYLGGTISAESTEDQGMRITVNLPFQTTSDKQQAYTKVEGNKGLLIDEDYYYLEVQTDNAQVQNTEGEVTYELMIVEDNEEMRKFLCSYFSRFYKVTTANDGVTALEIIGKRVPDVIISDVVMPKMGGDQLCTTIKNNIDTSHIPFILLTAKSTVENRIEGLEVGADAYLPKPFNLQELRLMIKNTLESRNSLKQHFLKFGSVDNYDHPVNNKDHEFLTKLIEIVHQHLEDPAFNIAEFSRVAGVSRTLLHMKLKKLVNLSATEFVKAIRLKKSTNLLIAGNNVSEVAYKVGFNDPNYFSRAFKEKYGIPPSEYKEENEPNENRLGDLYAFINDQSSLNS